MKAFYAKTGNHKLRFKPAYNPYTEPSMEVFSWHEGLQKWIEIANVSGFNSGQVYPADSSLECSGRRCWSRWACRRA